MKPGITDEVSGWYKVTADQSAKYEAQAAPEEETAAAKFVEVNQMQSGHSEFKRLIYFHYC